MTPIAAIYQGRRHPLLETAWIEFLLNRLHLLKLTRQGIERAVTEFLHHLADGQPVRVEKTADLVMGVFADFGQTREGIVATGIGEYSFRQIGGALFDGLQQFCIHILGWHRSLLERNI